MATKQCSTKAMALVQSTTKPPRLKPITVTTDGSMASDRIIPFGEYKGQSLGSLPSGYLGRLADTLKFRDGPWKEYAQLAEGVLQLRREYRREQVRLKFQVIHAIDRTLKRTSAKNALAEVDKQNVNNPDLIYGSLLRRCCKYRSLEEGREIHKHIVESNLLTNRYLGNLVVNMYVKCGRFNEAREVFDSLVNRNDWTYSIMISACVKENRPLEALQLWEQLEGEGVVVDKFIVTSVISACTQLQALEEGRAIHEHVVVTGFKTDNTLELAFLQMYAKCGSLEDAKRVFEGMEFKDKYCWSAMISAYAKAGQGEMAVVLYRRMISEGLEPNAVIYASALAGCASVGALADGRAIHQRILASKVEQDNILQDALLHMYLKCGEIGEARGVFESMYARNVRSYTAMMSAYVQNGEYHEALKQYRRMCTKEIGVEANAFTYATVLGAVEGLEDVELGRQLHATLASKGFQINVVVQNALVTMYGKCGSPLEAKQVFDGMEVGSRNVISWTSMIAAYAQHGYPDEALKLFKQMDVEPNEITFSSALNACAWLGALQEGTGIHGTMLATGYRSYISLINMYARCGELVSARKVFAQIRYKDSFSCNAMIAAYTQHGQRRQALRVLRKMELEGMSSDTTTFTSVLVGCSHARLAEESRKFFHMFVADHVVSPSVEHYLCVVDALARAGKLRDAEELVDTMPFKPDTAAWMTLLTGCKVHGDLERGRRAAEQVFTLAPKHPLPYVFLSSMYTAAKRFEDAAAVRRRMDAAGVSRRSAAARCWIEVGDELHSFASGEDEQQTEEESSEVEKVRCLLEALLKPMKQAGYVPDTREVMEDVGEAEKERLLCFHSERMAIGYGLIAGDDKDEQPLRVFNSSRVCWDCHGAIKVMSGIAGRKIVVRDTGRFHQFHNGACSCGDHW